MAELAHAQAPAAVEDQRRRRAAHGVSLHRSRNCVFRIALVDADRKTDPIFVQKGLQRRLRPLRLVMLEHGVQPDHRKLALGKRLARAQRLRQAFAYAAGAEHLKRHHKDDAPAQARERERRRRVEPVRDLPFRRRCFLHALSNLDPRNEIGAPGPSRTGTTLRQPDFESGASTSSATGATRAEYSGAPPRGKRDLRISCHSGARESANPESRDIRVLNWIPDSPRCARASGMTMKEHRAPKEMPGTRPGMTSFQ